MGSLDFEHTATRLLIPGFLEKTCYLRISNMLSIATVAVVLLLGMSNPTNGGLNFLTITDFHLNYEITHVMDIDPSEFSDENDMDIGTFYQITSAIENYSTYALH